MKHLTAMTAVLCLTLACVGQPVRADTFDFGAGLGFVNSPDNEGFEGGWDLQAGYGFASTDNWNLGGQLHLIRGWTSRSKVINSYPSASDMYFHSNALYATARPQYKWLQWLQFKGGLVSADYQTPMMAGRGTGWATGVGIVIGNEEFRIHLLDYHHYIVAGHTFDTYTITLAIFFAP